MTRPALAVIGLAVLTGGTASYACYEMYVEEDTNETVKLHEGASECTVDADCVLMPAQMTCCGDCEAVPPFRAVPRATYEDAALDLEAECQPRNRVCEPPSCQDAAEGCEARPVCVRGTCHVEATGCLEVGVP